MRAVAVSDRGRGGRARIRALRTIGDTASYFQSRKRCGSPPRTPPSRPEHCGAERSGAKHCTGHRCNRPLPIAAARIAASPNQARVNGRGRLSQSCRPAGDWTRRMTRATLREAFCPAMYAQHGSAMEHARRHRRRQPHPEHALGARLEGVVQTLDSRCHPVAFSC